MEKLTKLLLIFVFAVIALLSTNVAHGQVVIDWQKCFGGTQDDEAYSFKQTPDSGYILLGFTESLDGDITQPYGNKDMWLVKTDKDGNLEWQKSYGGTNDDQGLSIDFTADGGYILCGFTASNDSNVTSNYGMNDVWLVRTDSLGNIVWQNCFGGNKNEVGNSVIATSDGGFVVAGRTGTSSLGNVQGYHGNTDIWIFKVDSIGTFLWQKCLGGSLYEEAFSIKETADNGYIIAGGTYSSDFDVWSIVDDGDTWLIKIDSVGTIIWQKTFGGNRDERYHSVILTSDGGYLMVGQSNSQIYISGTNGYLDALVVKVNQMGDLEWQQCFGGNGDDFATQVVETPSGEFLIGGRAWSLNHDLTGNLVVGAWILKLSSMGNLIWQKAFGGTQPSPFIETGIRDLMINNEGNYTLACYTNTNTGNISGNHGLKDFWLVKISEQYNIINGKSFIDANSNNVCDSGEVAIKNLKMEESTTGKFDFTDSIGNYNILITDTGLFDFSPANIPYYSFAPAFHSAVFDSSAVTDTLNDFAFQPIGTINDLCITITPMGPFRSGFNAAYSINYSNQGTTTLSPTIIFYPDTNLTFTGANPTPSASTSDSVIWNLGPLAPFEDGNILVTSTVDQGLPLNTIINSGALIEPIAGDTNAACNQSYWEVFVTGSYDPNDILVSRDELLNTELVAPPYLHYIIRFQNTGNDTAFFVRIENSITSMLDLNTFEIVSSSHQMDVKSAKQPRLMEFIFDNILLPDSNTNEPESHGFVRYRIKPISTLYVGNSILNNGGIYFDFNQPVLTNTAITEIVLPVSSNELNTKSNLFSVYPNPFQNEINVLIKGLEGEFAAMGIYDVYGRKIVSLIDGSISEDNFEIKTDLSELASGIYFIQLQTNGEMRVARIVKGN